MGDSLHAIIFLSLSKVVSMEDSRKKHWETVYGTKQPNEVSWTQEHPATSLNFIHSFSLPKTANIIDVGGGDSRLVDFLLDEGYENVTVLDISEKALDRAKARLGERAAKVKWVTSDITNFQPDAHYDVWHDRATFHFLTTHEQIDKYLATAKEAINGYLVIGTFSDNGPKKCSGLDVKQYTEEQLLAEVDGGFQKIRCITEDHVTPFSTKQNFLFCSFKRA
jgi:2-polyprenyl-3-methyl-5-hydroxy-6-metoxy-1,4-benzoquinol methylase